MKDFYTMVNYFVYEIDGFDKEALGSCFTCVPILSASAILLTCKPQVNISGNISYIPGADELVDMPGVMQMSDVFRVSVP